MPVSSSLQKYFDSQRKKNGDMQKKFDKLAGQIDPAFAESFLSFRERILEIVDESEANSSAAMKELDLLWEKLEVSSGKNKIKKIAVIYDAVK